MRRLRAWLLRLGGLFHKEQRDRELADELESHLQMHIEDNLRSGMSPTEARRQALIKLGGIEQTKERYRDRRGILWLEMVLQDLRFGGRMLRKNPGFTAVAVLTLALGIGANTAIFSVVQGVVLAPLPYREPDRLVAIWLKNLTLKYDTDLSYSDFLDWQRNSRSFQQMAALEKQSYDLTGSGTPGHLDGDEVSSGFFSTLGVDLALGREFTPQEDHHGGTPVAVISDRLWKNRFQSSPEALGRSMILNGVDYTIAGILPPTFHFWTDADVYTPLGQSDPEDLSSRTIHDIACFARLKPEVNIGQGQADMNAVQENLDQIYPNEERGLETDVLPLKEFLVGDVRGTLLLLLGAVGVVLLIACTNVANLLLARSSARTREFAIRSALGADRPRIVRQLVTESVLLSLAGGGLGLAVAKWGLNAVLAAVPGNLPRSENIGVNVSVLLFAFGVSIAVGILFGFAPALKSSQVDLQASLKEGGRGSTRAHHRAQGSLVIVQMALTVVLLVGAGLLFRTIRHLWGVNPGFDAQHVITFRVGLSPSVTRTGSDTRIAFQQLIERIRQIPGVQAADLTTLVPLNGHDNSIPFWIDSRKPASMAEAPRVLGYAAGPDYLRVMGIPLLQGRFINQTDTINSALVVVIDTTLAQTYFQNEDPVGQTISFPGYGPYRIVGVVGHVSHYELGNTNRGTQNQGYVAFYQFSDRSTQVMNPVTTVVVRTPLDTATVIPAIKAVVYGAGNDQPIYNVKTMQEIVSDSMSSQRFPMLLLEIFAGLALLLASVGIYGVVSYSVAQRMHEIGIRMALGAERSDIFRMVIGQGLRLTFVGLASGTAVALILSRFLSSFSDLLYGVRANDPLTLIAVSLVLTVVAILACYVPARRAMHVDPMVALRHE